jgi:hypothetical protein
VALSQPDPISLYQRVPLRIFRLLVQHSGRIFGHCAKKN